MKDNRIINDKHNIARGAIASVVAVSLAAMPVAGFAAPQIINGDQGTYIVNKVDGNRTVVSLQDLDAHIAGKSIGNKQALVNYVSGNQVLLQDLQQVNTAALDGDYAYLGAEIDRIVSQAAVVAASYPVEDEATASASEAVEGVTETEDVSTPTDEGTPESSENVISPEAPEGSGGASSDVPTTDESATVDDTNKTPDSSDPTPVIPEGSAPETPSTPDVPSSDIAPSNPNDDAAQDVTDSSTSDSTDEISIPKVPPASSQSPYAADVVPHINTTLPTLSQQESVEISEYIPSTIAVNLTTEKFIGLIGEQARQIAADNDLYASVMIAQAILESGSGSSALSLAPYNNLFGIKGFYKGKSVAMRTMEDDGTGNYYSIRADFRRYPTLAASLEDYADLLTRKMGDFYAPVHKSNAETYVQACDYLQGHYATSTTYSKKLQLIIDAYGLTAYDEALPFTTVDTFEVPAVDNVTGEAIYDEETGKQASEMRDLPDLVSKSADLLGASYSADRRNTSAFNSKSLLSRIYGDALGVEISPLSFTALLSSEDIDLADLHMGDILFFEKEGDAEAYDMAMYMTNGCFVEASESKGLVVISSMEEKTPSFAKRLIEVRNTDDPIDTITVEDEADSQEMLTGLYDELGIRL